MSASLEWVDTEQTIILCRFEGEFDVENYAVMEGALPMQVREKSERVDVIFYLSEGSKWPPLQGVLPEMGIMCNMMPDNFGCLVGVGNGFFLTNPLSIFIATLLKPLYYRRHNEHIHVAASVADAVTKIHALRQ